MTKDAPDVLSELRALKMLMILQLLRDGVKQGQIAAILGVSEPTMSRMLPKGIARSVSKGNPASAAEGGE